MTPLIRALESELRAMLRKDWPTYTVPGLWVGGDAPVTFPNPASYLLHQFQVIDRDERARRHRPWDVSRALAYNGMVRHITSYAHGPGVEESGWRHTGTFLKLAAMLPYLVRMDVDTLVLQPITEIGVAGKKGTLGSPYAVRHPLHLDAALAEPAVALSIEDQARILVEMCHAVGIRVVVETVLRTASVDSALAQTHPEWFYWVDESKVNALPDGFKPPTFSPEELEVMTTKVKAGDLQDLPEPSAEYRDLFTPPPLRLETDEDGWKGIAPKQRVVRIPGAFADWPANDVQPPWSDVTYLRLHDHPHYSYMAYNTIRMYEQALDTDEYRSKPLWNTVASFIPYYIRSLNIDGAMIDMGHALPLDLRTRVMREARALKSDFILFEENFHISHSAAANGYDAAIGNLPLFSSTAAEIKTFIQERAADRGCIRYFGSPESHNTPRIRSRWESDDAVAAVWTLLRVLPGAVGFIHAGIELGETIPVNTGLGFTSEEAMQYTPEDLPLFSDVPLTWDAETPVLAAIVRTACILHGTSFWEHASGSDTLVPLESPDACIAYLRIPDNSRQGLLCVANLSGETMRTRLRLPADSGVMFLAPNTHIKRAGASIDVELAPWAVELVFTLH